MSTILQRHSLLLGAGSQSRGHRGLSKTLTMVAGASVSDSITVPLGSWLASIRAEVPTAFSGSPTNINLSVGNAAAGAQVVAATDIKAQGHFPLTIVASFDVQAGTATYYFTLAAVAGTNPAGTVNVVLSYYPPVPGV